MKAAVFAAISALVGVAIGLLITQREFSHEAMPIDITPVSGGVRSSGIKIGPKITVVNSERYDFGTLERNAHGSHDFIIRNDGDAPLTLKPGQPSCSVCIKVFTVEKETLQPGERTTAKIEW